MRMTETVKREMARAVDRVVNNCWPNRKYGLCLQRATVGSMLLAQRGVRAIIQAGSASWPCIDLALDDGKMDTHFSYQWAIGQNIDPATVEDQLPEMHCWLAIPKTRELVDFSMGEQPRLAALTAGLTWTGPLPPEYLWTDSLPEGVYYEPNAEAIRLAVALMGKLLIVAAGMFAFGYLLAPIYKAICNWTGVNVLALGEREAAGSLNARATAKNTQVDYSRTVMVEFDTNARGPWKFRPEIRNIQLHPGELTTVMFEKIGRVHV